HSRGNFFGPRVGLRDEPYGSPQRLDRRNRQGPWHRRSGTIRLRPFNLGPPGRKTMSTLTAERKQYAAGRLLALSGALAMGLTGLVVAIWPETIAIMLGTFLSEDLTSIATGLLIQEGTLGWLPGILGCFLGIYFGDLGLWLLGRFAGPWVVPWAR